MSDLQNIFESVKEIVGDSGSVVLDGNKIKISYYVEARNSSFGDSESVKISRVQIFTFLPESREYKRTETGSSSSFSSSSSIGDQQMPFNLAELGNNLELLQKGLGYQKIEKEVVQFLTNEGWEQHRGWLRKKLGF